MTDNFPVFIMKEAYDLARRTVRPKTFITEVLEAELQKNPKDDEEEDPDASSEPEAPAQHSDLGKRPPIP